MLTVHTQQSSDWQAQVGLGQARSVRYLIGVEASRSHHVRCFSVCRLAGWAGQIVSQAWRCHSLFIDQDGEIRRLIEHESSPTNQLFTKKLKPTDFYNLCLTISFKISPINKPTKIVTLQVKCKPPSQEINENPSEEGNEIPKQNI